MRSQTAAIARNEWSFDDECWHSKKLRMRDKLRSWRKNAQNNCKDKRKRLINCRCVPESVREPPIIDRYIICTAWIENDGTKYIQEKSERGEEIEMERLVLRP